MKVLAITNLYPRPDQPSRGMFNAQLFAEMAKLVDVRVLCLVPEWRVWRWGRIREFGVRSSDVGGQRTEGRGPRTEDRGQRTESGVEVTYVPVFYVPLVGRFLSWRTYWWSLRRLVNGAMGRYDAVYSAWLYPDGVVGARLARSLGIPSWMMALGSDTFHLQSPRRRALVVDACNSGETVCVARHLKERLVNAGVSGARLHVVPNGVDSRLFRPRARQEALAQLKGMIEREDVNAPSPKHAAPGTQHQAPSTKHPAPSTQHQARSTRHQAPSTKHSAPSPKHDRAAQARALRDIMDRCPKVVLFVGNLVPVKGSDLLIEAFAKMIRKSEDGGPRTEDGRQRTEANLVVIGDGLMRKRLQVRANELGVADCVHFLGSRPHQEIALWMNAADVLCLPSRSEGMPNVLLEAVAGGLPFAAADVGACSEIHRQYGGGVIFKPEDAGSLEAVLADCLAGRYKERSSRAVRTWSDSARDIVDLMSADTNSAPVCRNG